MAVDGNEGWCGGHTVFIDDGAPSSVLGPDGQPVKYVRRHVAGFDLRPKRLTATHGATERQVNPAAGVTPENT